ncbi:MAG TPA: hypothetical protein VMM56_10240 [Planctomycetaceae bacterium]|nr:hypothetical protein [Planctomycetaceae bacterium]
MASLKQFSWIVLTAIVAVFSSDSSHAAGVGSNALASMPIREVTVFKDGHAFVLHEGDVTTDGEGNVLLDYLPTPVIGTFWPYADDPNAKLRAVSAGKQRVSLEKTALSIRDLLAANVGARVEIREGDKYYRATITGIPASSAEEQEAAAPAGSGPQVSQPGQLILLQTETGTRAIPIDRIQDVTFIDNPTAQLEYEEIRNLLKLQLDWNGQAPAKTARVGMTYLQKGLRWIPHYKLHIDGDGTVKVQLQATLLNELADLDNVTANLLVGVPSFDFKSTVDPIALRETAAQLSQYFQEGSQTAHAFSNSMMVGTQVARMSDFRHAPVQPAGDVDVGPDVANTGRNEEMFVFTIKDVTLAKGERMVLPVGEWTMKYRDVFRLEIPFSPPLEVQQNFNSSQQAELAKLFHAPKVKHVLRVTNDQQIPLTTAPALITSDRGVLGQGMMTYTSPGSSVDLTVTTAVNVPVSHKEDEIKRTPEAIAWRNHTYMRIDMQGTIKLTNYRDKDIELEVVRTVMGAADSVEADGTIRRPSAWDEDFIGRPHWWGWYSWPYWWTHMNSFSRFEWNQTLKAGEGIELSYKWHYFWTY